MATPGIRNVWKRIVDLWYEGNTQIMGHNGITMAVGRMFDEWSSAHDESRAYPAEGSTFAGWLNPNWETYVPPPPVKNEEEIRRLLICCAEGWAVDRRTQQVVSGIYDHFKGGVYIVLLPLHKWTGDEGGQVVLYTNLTSEVFARHVDVWTEIVKWPDGKYRPRFVLRGDPSKEPSFKVLASSGLPRTA
jgi:hypothetical protein